MKKIKEIDIDELIMKHTYLTYLTAAYKKFCEEIGKVEESEKFIDDFFEDIYKNNFDLEKVYKSRKVDA